MEINVDDLIFPLDTTTLNRCFIKLISSGDDFHFQESIQVFLPVFIRSLEVQNEDFRKRALEVLIHITKRIKSRPEIQIPVRNLLEIFVDSTRFSPFASNFAMIYIKIGFLRLTPNDQLDLIPLIFQILTDRTNSHEDLLFGLIVNALQYVEINPNSTSNLSKFRLNDRPEVRRAFLDFLLDVILLPYKFDESKTSNSSTTRRNYIDPSQPPVDELLFSTMDDAPSKEVEVFKQPFPCLNESIYKRLVEAIQTEELTQVEKMKVSILKFLNGNIYKEDEIVFHVVLATADSRYSVVLAAEHDIKRLTVAVDWNQLEHVENLFEFFLGTAKTKRTSSKIRNPSNIRIRIKLFPFFLRSRMASQILPHAIQVLYESLFGNSTNVRVKYFSLQFAQNVIENAEINGLIGISKLLLNAFEKLWNSETSQTHDASRLRSLTYVLIGKLSYRVPKLFVDDIRLTQKFFEALKTENSECCLNIHEALTLLAFSQKDANVASKHILQQLLTDQVRPSIDSSVDFSQCRQAAVSFVMNVFPPNDATSRFILLTACNDKNEDIRTSASRNLFSSSDENLPTFSSLFDLIWKNCLDRPTNLQTIYYLHRCLIRSSFSGEKSTPFWKYEEKLAFVAEKCQNERKIWRNYVEFLLKYLLVFPDGLSTFFLLESIIAGFHLHDDDFDEFIRENLASFRQLSLFCFSRDETRRFASILYAFVLWKQKNFEKISTFIDELLKISINENQRVEQRESSLVVLSNFCSFRKIFDEIFSSTKQILIKTFLDERNDLMLASIIGIGQLARRRCFSSIESPIVEKLQRKLRTINETNRIKEKIIETIGFLSICCRDQTKQFIEILTDSLVETKQIELHLNIGDALICCLVGDATALAKDPFLILEDQNDVTNIDIQENLFEFVLDRILRYSSDVNNPHTRQAAFFWLLTFLVHCRRPFLQTTFRNLFESKIFDFQTNFVFGLIDQDELNQELAAKCLIYFTEIIDDENLRTKFNEKLFEHFNDNTRSFANQRTTLAYEHNVQTSSSSTSIDNSQLILYKEFFSFVELLNVSKNEKSQLFYAFLYLAHENSIWSTTRHGQTFRFNEYENKSIELILIYVEKFVARLYRLTFDPQLRVQEAMKRIWKKMFASSKQILIVDKYFPLIFNELFTEMLSSRWRVRESVQSAFYEIFRMLNRKLIDQQEYIRLFAELFRRLFSVCDDTKESVRKVALTSINAFKQNCILLACDPATTISNSISDEEHRKRARDVLEQILPILLHDGLYNKNEDIAKFSLTTIIEIIRYGNRDTLKPYCTLIIIALFEALSSIEPDAFNYASLKVSAAEMKEQIDMARILCARSSPVMDAITTCTNQFVDETILDELSGKLIETIKHSIGLTTKCLIGQYLITLTNLYPETSSKFVGKWMAVLVNTMSNNSNRTLRKTFTSVLGSIVRIAKRSSIENLFQKLSTWFYQNENDYQYVCALTLNSISQSNHEMISEFSSQILPLIFIAMQQKSSSNTAKTDDERQEETIWQNLWIENTGSSSSAIEKHFREFVEQIRMAVEHRSYPMKIQGARAIQMISETLKNQMKIDHFVLLVELILKGLYGRVYEGKEEFLRAAQSICVNCKNSLRSSADLLQRFYDVIEKECKKESLVYRSMAIRVLSLLADEFQFDVFDLFWIWFEKAFKPEEPNEGEQTTNQIDVDEDPIVSDAFHRTLIECLPQVWPRISEIESKYLPLIVELLVEILRQSNWQKQLLVVESVNKILLKSSNLSSNDVVRLFEPIVNLGPRSKSSRLKDEVLIFVGIFLENPRLSMSFDENCQLNEILQFNIDEMIFESRSTEIAEKAKDLKKRFEHFFRRKIENLQKIEMKPVEDLF